VTPLLLRITAAAFLSLASFLVIIFRVSPLTAPGLAVPFFFLTLFLVISTTSTLAFYGVWSHLSVEGMDAGKKIGVSLREALFLASATSLLLLFQVLGIFTWWIGVLIYLVFVLVELALHS
jgi:hypothetical protein